MLPLPLRLLFQGVYLFPGFPSDPWFLRQNSCFLRRYPVLPRFLHAVPRMVRGGGGGGRGLGTCVASRRLHPCTYFYLGVKSNLLSQLPILDPIPDNVPAGDWGAKLHGLSVSRTSQRRLQCVRLLTPILAKGFLPFYLPCLYSIEKWQLDLRYLAFHSVK